MGNFYGTGRSNYFEVKDLDAFRTWLDQFPAVELIESEDGNFLVGFTSTLECGSLPSFYYVEDEEKEVDFLEELSKHLVEDSVAIFIMAGHDKLRYVSGHAMAINSKGELQQVSLSDIYTKAESLGKNITVAEY